ncbi:MAG: peptidoglycan-binding protein, partial [Pseudomonadota bacterium]
MLVAFLVSLLLLLPLRTPASAYDDALRAKIESADALDLGGALASTDRLRAAYEALDYAPLWIDGEAGRLRAEALLEALRSADKDGLVPQEYLARWPDANAAVESSEGALTYELTLTDLFLAHANHLYGGRTSASISSPDIVIPRKRVDVAAAVRHVRDQNEVRGYHRAIVPQTLQYGSLKKMLAGFRRLADAGGWPAVSSGETLKPDMANPRVLELRANLAARGYGGLDLTDAPDVYDNRLVATVRHFQSRHGLEADGVVGKMTLAAMNVPADDRVRQIKLNMERWRWLPNELGDWYIMVNQAAFELRGVRGGVPDMRMN